MTAERIKSALGWFERGKELDEPWLIRHGKELKEELDVLVGMGYLVRFDADPYKFMSDNRYMITEAGFKFVRSKQD